MNNNQNIDNNDYQNQNNQQNLYVNQQTVINSQQIGLNNSGAINDNSQNVNTPLKKSNFGLIIAIVAVVVAVVVIIFVSNYFLNVKESGKDLLNNNGQTNSEKDNLNVNWDDYELVIDGVSIKLPMTYKEFMSKGFYIQNYSHSNPDAVLQNQIEDRIIAAGTTLNLYVHSKVLASNGSTNNINLMIYNPDDEGKPVSESYIVGVYNEEPYTVSTTKYGEFKIINHTKNTEVIVGKTTRDEVLDLFGDFHYPTDSSDKLTYYCDFNGDNVLDLSDVVNHEQLLGLVFDDNTGILKITDFSYLNYGDLSN